MKFVKVMFSQVSVCPNGECPCTAWGVCTCLVGRIWAGTPPLGRYTPWAGTHPWAGTPLGRHLPGRYTPQTGTPWAGLPQAGTPPATVHAGIQSTRGWYVSHWNAFLFQEFSSFKCRVFVAKCTDLKKTMLAYSKNMPRNNQFSAQKK